MKKIAEFKIIQENGENGNVYLVENSLAEKFIIKQFNKAVQPCIGYGKKNHYGRRREGSDTVINEIKNISNKYGFIIDFIKRFKWKNQWCTLIEYIDGITLGRFIEKNKDNREILLQIVNEFAKEVALWHKNDFALGDPHLDNVIVEKKTNKIKLIDYSQIHHPSFKYCKKYDCFNPNNKRKKQDLVNKTGHFGKGFITELDKIENRLKINFDLSNIFQNSYKNIINENNL